MTDFFLWPTGKNRTVSCGPLGCVDLIPVSSWDVSDCFLWAAGIYLTVPRGRTAGTCSTGPSSLKLLFSFCYVPFFLPRSDLLLLSHMSIEFCSLVVVPLITKVGNNL